MKTNYLLIFGIALITIFSCTKEGPMGPQGPAGPQGATGATGATGNDGNANIHTMVINVTPSEWNSSSTNELHALKAVTIITNDIVNNGAVLVYWKSTNSNSYQALPMTWPGTDKIYRFWYSQYLLNIQIYRNNAAPTRPTETYTYKVITIEGNVSARNLPINTKNYNEVKEYFNLTD